MGAIAKLIAAIRENPKDLRFDDACRAAEWLGFHWKGGKGSHRVFAKRGALVQLNFQNRNGKIPPCQARQLPAMIDLYGDDQ